MDRHRYTDKGGRPVTRREFLRGGLVLAAGVGAATLVGCGDDSPESVSTPTAGVSPMATVQAPVSPTATAPAALAPAFTRLSPGGESPPARRDHSLTAAASGPAVYLFGGRAGTGDLGDLWAYDTGANRWAKLTPGGAAPPPRFGHNAVYDDKKGRLVVFGGQAGSGGFFADVWAYELAANRWIQLTDGGPAPRYGSGSALGADGKGLFISHGFTNSGRFDDTWSFSLESDSWTDVSSPGERPLRRCLLRMAADPARQRLLLFGGQSNSEPFHGDLWGYGTGDKAWRRLEANGPSPRNLYALSSAGDKAILFGGRTQSGSDNETWLLDLAADQWRQLQPEGELPAARDSHDSAWLPDKQAVLIFGGQAGGDVQSDLWLLALS